MPSAKKTPTDRLLGACSG